MNTKTDEKMMSCNEAFKAAKTEWKQFSTRIYVRGNEVVVRDFDNNVVTTYPFVTVTQTTFGF